MCEAKFLSIQCNKPHGHEGAHAIGTIREHNRFFPRNPGSEMELKCPAGCTKDHWAAPWLVNRTFARDR